ncbi:hypothetical protein BO71DRAFT_422438 [Aspergillus ellipticus CBS 707.79]|uniref:Xylanolytic transcriptional activator regulatory domain-containing protein n=1 Tax=Aspergillus ellipticus CBS 707.79 TaxID=1448320 RepID=A0A319CY47_9EURO|nr:hypothetical protein BO71DRAFT_422438 [Aspergillus ellipticus CBS 707.79]
MGRHSSLAEPPELRACSGAAPCAYCVRTRKRCRFDRVPSRTPLTRKNLDEKERLCSGLIALIHKLQPDVDIAEALKTLSAPTEGTPDGDTGNGLSPEGQQIAHDRSSPTPSAHFEWNEALLSSSRVQEKPLDGMASLPARRSGYLGNSSGSSLLRNISDLLPEHHAPAARSEDSRVASRRTESPLMSADLSNAVVLDGLIDAYFVSFNAWYPILHEGTFRQKYQDRHQVQAGSSWHLIFHLVLAIGDWIRAGGSKIEESTYYMAARSRMSMHLLESGSLLTVQAFLLVGYLLQKRDRPNTGYNYIGIAYRMALGLGLHREPLTRPDALVNERRRVVWWVVYTFDSGFSITTGRPLMSADCFIETRLPRNIEDSTCSLDMPAPNPVDKPTTYSAIIAFARLAGVGNMVYRDVIAAPKKTLDLKVSRSLDHQLKAWRLSLPVYFTAHDVPNWFRGPRAVVSWKEQNLRMMLWWGSQRLCSSPSDIEEALNMCHYAAIECIQDVTTYCLDHPDTIHISLSWYATYFLFQASVVLSIHHLRFQAPPDTSLAAANQELWLFSLSRARDCLADLSEGNEGAAQCLEVLDRIKAQSQPLSTSAAGSTVDVDHDLAATHLMDEGARPGTLAVDPSLQMFFDATSWNRDLFEGLEGFPITNEVESFDYVPGNVLTHNVAEDWPDPNLPT